MGVLEAHCHKLQTKCKPPSLFSFLLLKVTTKQTTNKAFRNKNLKTKRGRWKEGWA